MFDPDLGYYLRALRAGKRIIVVGFLVGAMAGLLIGVIKTGQDWEVSQLVRIEKNAVSPTVGPRGLLSLPTLPDRKVLDEASLARVLADELNPPSTIIVVPDDQAGTMTVFSASGSKSAADRDLKLVLDAYQKDRIGDYDRRLAESVAVVKAVQDTAQASLDKLDAEISTTPAESIVLAQALVAQRAEVSDLLESSVGTESYLAGFRAGQTGGVTLSGDPEFKQQPPTGSGFTLAIVLGIVGAVVGAIAVMVRRMARRRIESPADLALFSSIVSVGDLAYLEPLTLSKIAMAAAHAGAGKVIITESLAGGAASQLQSVFASHGITAETYPPLLLPTLGPADRIVLAIDRTMDSEQSVEDLLELLSGVVPRPVLAVLC